MRVSLRRWEAQVMPTVLEPVHAHVHVNVMSQLLEACFPSSSSLACSIVSGGAEEAEAEAEAEAERDVMMESKCTVCIYFLFCF